MKIPNTLPVTAEQSRAARFQLGLTQADAILQSELPGWKLKQFETGRFVPDIPFLQKLKEFYVSKGIEFSGAIAAAQANVETVPGPAVGAATHSRAPGAAFPFFLCSDLTEAQGAAITERILENDERCATLLNMPLKDAFFGGFNEATDAAIRELFGRFAESYMLISRLQGRVFVAPAEGEPSTVADFVAKYFASSPLVSLAGDRHIEGQARRLPEEGETGEGEEFDQGEEA